MSCSSNVDADFVHYLESMVNLDALDRITADLGSELKDSQQVMNQIKGMIDCLPKNPQDLKLEPNNSGFRHEDISNFLNDKSPKLLMSDMDENSCDIDMDELIATVKSYAEDIKKSLETSQPQGSDAKEGFVKKEIVDLDLEKYASSLDVLCKRLNTLKLNKRDEETQRSPDLEAKLSVLCDDVKMFTQMVQAKATLSETNKNWTPAQHQNDALDYDQIISKLLSGINEVSYLLHNKN